MTAAPVITTDRLVLRRPAARDLEAAIAFYMSERSQYAGGNVPRFVAWKNFSAVLGHWEMQSFGLWAVTAKGDDSILGLVGPYYPDGWPEHELGWVMFEGSEGRGIAQEAVRAARSHAFETLGWSTAVSYIAPENHRSIKLAERLGAELDPNAAYPKPDQPCLVYRHPSPQEIRV
ncbi:GNAT family N-acetyltransferase [Epibacterium ulvae]|uniref:GNAT family N-acetyltransferase n=1 Tax=Epibacterium ulvae TaxID=1156985 RepID=UPI000B7CF9B1|nr:GNAT family N-acetyltransferase [Epibacterium ulvae]